MPGKSRTHYTGDYKTRADRVREQANADPQTKCWRCGKTLAEARRADPSVTWTAGHTVDGNSAHPLAPEHSSCNFSAGGKLGSHRRWLNPSRRWY